MNVCIYVFCKIICTCMHHFFNKEVLYWRFMETVHHNLKHAQDVKGDLISEMILKWLFFNNKKVVYL